MVTFPNVQSSHQSSGWSGLLLETKWLFIPVFKLGIPYLYSRNEVRGISGCSFFPEQNISLNLSPRLSTLLPTTLSWKSQSLWNSFPSQNIVPWGRFWQCLLTLPQHSSPNLEEAKFPTSVTKGTESVGAEPVARVSLKSAHKGLLIPHKIVTWIRLQQRGSSAFWPSVKELIANSLPIEFYLQNSSRKRIVEIGCIKEIVSCALSRVVVIQPNCTRKQHLDIQVRKNFLYPSGGKSVV